MKTLIVEDDFTSRLLLQRLLNRYGECHIAVNGREAVSAFRTALEEGGSYDLICMDIMMPEMDGQEALKEIRSIEEERNITSTRGAEIVMTTALAEIRNVAAAYGEFCDGYLVKPIDKGKLIGVSEELALIDPVRPDLP